jgi:hypothetical protein
MDAELLREKRHAAIVVGKRQPRSKGKGSRHDPLMDFALGVEDLRLRPLGFWYALSNGYSVRLDHMNRFGESTILAENQSRD